MAVTPFPIPKKIDFPNICVQKIVVHPQERKNAEQKQASEFCICGAVLISGFQPDKRKVVTLSIRQYEVVNASNNGTILYCATQRTDV